MTQEIKSYNQNEQMTRIKMCRETENIWDHSSGEKEGRNHLKCLNFPNRTGGQ